MPLTIKDFSPRAGEPGSVVHILGTDFFDGARVFFYHDVEGVGVERNSDTILYAKVPQGAIDGPITVQVGTARKISDIYFWIKDEDYPKIKALKPDKGHAGGTLKIEGFNFDRHGGISVEMTGPAHANARVNHHSSGEITVTVPKLKPGKYRVIVHTAAGRDAEAKEFFTIEKSLG